MNPSLIRTFLAGMPWISAFLHKKVRIKPLVQVKDTPWSVLKMKNPRENTGSCLCHWNAYGTVLYCNGILQSLSIRFIGKVSSSQIRYQRTPSRGRVLEVTLIHYFWKHFSAFWGKARIMHNADNSWATGRARRKVGFFGSLVVQTFNCQVFLIY